MPTEIPTPAEFEPSMLGPEIQRYLTVRFCPRCGRNHECPDVYPESWEYVEVECECGHSFWYEVESVHYFHVYPENPSNVG